MIKSHVPFAYAKSIFEIGPEFYQKNHIKVVLCDLDNTLDSAKTIYPSQNVVELKKFFDCLGIRLLIASNNTSKRVHTYARTLGVQAVCFLFKPLPFRFKSFLKDEGFNPEEVLLVGDQILTDVICGNKAKVKTLLVDPLTSYDPPWTKVNRFFEKGTRKALKEKKLVPEWRELI